MSISWNHPRIAFVYLKQSPNRLFSADYQWDCANMRAYLMEYGISSSQYVQSQLSTLFELADDLLSLGTDFVVCYTEAANQLLVGLLTKRLRESDDRLRIVWIGRQPDSGHQANSGFEGPEAWLDDRDAAGLYRLMGQTGTGEEPHSLVRVPPLYRDQWIPAGKAAEAGIRLFPVRLEPEEEPAYPGDRQSAEGLAEELDYLASSQVKGCIPVLDEDLFADPGRTGRLMEMLAERNDPFTFRGAFGLSRLKAENVAMLLGAGFTEIVVRLSQEETGFGFDSSDPGLADIRAMLAEHRASLRFEVSASAGRITPAEAGSLRRLIEGERKSSEQAFINGYIAYLTGLYPWDLLNGSVKHVAVAGRLPDPDQYAALGSFMSINSAVVVDWTRDTVPAEKNPAELQSEFYIDGGSSLRRTNPIYEYHKQASVETGSFPAHLLQLAPSGNRNVHTLQIDDLDRPERLHLSIAPYSAALPSTELSDELLFLNLDKPEDLGAFLADVDHFAETGSIRHEYQLTGFLTDSCRWGKPAMCRLHQLPRLRMDGEGKLFPCGGCSQSIGRAEDTYPHLLHQAAAHAEEEQLLRGCSRCEVKDRCPKCAFLPDFMSREQYCAIQKASDRIGSYMIAVQVLKLLRSNSASFKGLHLAEVKCSSRYAPLFVPAGLTAAETPTATEHAFLLLVKDNPVVFHTSALKLMKISRPMAAVLEACMLGVSTEELRNYFSESYQISSQQAESTIVQAIETLSDAGFVKPLSFV